MKGKGRSTIKNTCVFKQTRREIYCKAVWGLLHVVIMCVCDKTTEQCKVYFGRLFYTFQHVKIDKERKKCPFGIPPWQDSSWEVEFEFCKRIIQNGWKQAKSRIVASLRVLCKFTLYISVVSRVRTNGRYTLHPSGLESGPQTLSLYYEVTYYIVCNKRKKKTLK